MINIERYLWNFNDFSENLNEISRKFHSWLCSYMLNFPQGGGVGGSSLPAPPLRYATGSLLKWYSFNFCEEIQFWHERYFTYNFERLERYLRNFWRKICNFETLKYESVGINGLSPTPHRNPQEKISYFDKFHFLKEIYLNFFKTS